MKTTKIEQLWYVPHQPVVNPTKLVNVQRVCNAASKHKDVALNGKLMSGPGSLRNFARINFRFREHEIAMTVIISAVFAN